MKLIIMRHGQASWSSASDFDRVLTFEGREEVSRSAQQLTGHAVDKVLASPYLRAQQTGRIVADILGCQMDTLESLVPDGHPPDVLATLPDNGSILLASHMPFVGRLTGLLCEGVMSNQFAFPTASAIILEMELPEVGMASITGRVSFS